MTAMLMNASETPKDICVNDFDSIYANNLQNVSSTASRPLYILKCEPTRDLTTSKPLPGVITCQIIYLPIFESCC
ncbi:hypothetical protein OIDMADRAFT_20807 [Oidiodendron maius Zn]|uniref:Uncharacterized protein n=1 Tax=Oidiodendron maius (strain Zn) TaxID=913774 RepID=A0A0C3CBY3_OIDMZ|nr:hypothetical protein OIDMADRAFT_20807 [Oidiodendron maius Zn]